MFSTDKEPKTILPTGRYDDETLYRQTGLSKAGLAKALGLSSNTVYVWRKLPGYAVAYLELLIEHQNMKEIVREAVR